MTTLPITAGSYAVVATVASTDYTGSASGTLVIQGTLTPFETSVAAISNPSLRTAASDPDGDGFCNLIEHATGTCLTQRQSIVPHKIDPSTHGFVMHLPGQVPADVHYMVQKSTTLGSTWTTWAEKTGIGAWSGTQPASTISDGLGGTWVVFPVVPAGAGFYRLKVELVSP